MARFKLVPYIVRIRKKHARKFRKLSDVDGEGNDGVNLILDCLGGLKQARIMDDSQRTLLLEELESKGRDILGLTKAGDYGLVADFLDVDSGVLRPEARREVDAEMVPFFFHFRMPKKAKKGLLILQMTGVSGIKTILEQVLNECLEHLDLKIVLNRLVSQELLQQVEGSRLIELRLIRYDVPRDIAEQVHQGGAEEIVEERLYRPKRALQIRLAERLREALAEREARYYEVLGEQYDEIKAVIKRGSSYITLTFGEGRGIRESMPLDDENLPLEGGFPSFGFLKARSREYIGHLADRLAIS